MLTLSDARNGLAEGARSWRGCSRILAPTPPASPRCHPALPPLLGPACSHDKSTPHFQVRFPEKQLSPHPDYQFIAPGEGLPQPSPNPAGEASAPGKGPKE